MRWPVNQGFTAVSGLSGCAPLLHARRAADAEHHLACRAPRQHVLHRVGGAGQAVEAGSVQHHPQLACCVQRVDALLARLHTGTSQSRAQRGRTRGGGGWTRGRKEREVAGPRRPSRYRRYRRELDKFKAAYLSSRTRRPSRYRREGRSLHLQLRRGRVYVAVDGAAARELDATPAPEGLSHIQPPFPRRRRRRCRRLRRRVVGVLTASRRRVHQAEEEADRPGAECALWRCGPSQARGPC